MIFLFLLLLLTPFHPGAFMSFILDTRTDGTTAANYQAFVPVDATRTAVRLKVIPCHNYATASAYAAGRLPAVTAARDVAPRSVEQAGGCLTGGAGYDAAVTWVVSGRVERVSNWATAKTLARNNPVSAVDKSNYLWWAGYSERLDVTA